MINTNLLFFGGLFVDSIAQIEVAAKGGSNTGKIYTQIGGIANCLKFLKGKEGSFQVMGGVSHRPEEVQKYVKSMGGYLAPLPHREAEAIILQEKCFNTSVVDWGEMEDIDWVPELMDTINPDWIHIAYLDRLPKVIQYLRDNPIKCTVSVDLVDNIIRHDVRQCLHNVDYLIASDTEYRAYNTDHLHMANFCKRGALMHTPYKLVGCVDGKALKYPVKQKSNHSIVGAGDALAGLFAYHNGDAEAAWKEFGEKYATHSPQR